MTKKFVIVFSLMLVLIFLGSMTFVVTAQNQSIDIIESNLRKRNVPIKKLVLVSRIPFEVDIIINKISSEQTMSLDDLWNAQLARREAALASRFGLKVNKFKLVFVDDAGSTIFMEQNFINSDDNLQNSEIKEPKISRTETEDLIRHKLNLYGLVLDWIDVTYEPNLGDVGQNLLLQFSVSDLETANKIVPAFLWSLKQLIGDINDQSGAEISLCRLRILDKNHTVLLNFVWDTISKTETTSSVPGLVSWYPRPEPTKSKTQISTFFSTITPDYNNQNRPIITPQPYPAPTIGSKKSTSSPYPPP